MSKLHLLLVNPPQDPTRPAFGDTGVFFIPGTRAINAGILAIASFITARGYSVEIVDLLEDNRCVALKEKLNTSKPCVIGISCSNALSYLTSLKCTRIARELSPESLIIAGGQHIGPLARIALEECPDLDIVVRYEGEIPVEQIIKHYQNWGRSQKYSDIPGIVYRCGNSIFENREKSELVDLNEVPFLDFKLYPNFKKYHPYIEESRGCQFKCRFCTNTFTYQGRIRVKKYSRFLAEMKNIVDLYGTEPIYSILASNFGTSLENTSKIVDGLQRFGIRWQARTRTDFPWYKLADPMYKSGARIITIGLESASPVMLLRMAKTRTPKHYIERAHQNIDAFGKWGDLLLKLNIMIYFGENPSTFRETLGFLIRNASKLTAVQCSPLFAIPGAFFSEDLDSYAAQFGASFVREEYWEKVHVYPVNVSQYFSFEESSVLCNVLEKVFTNEQRLYEANQYLYGRENVELLKERVTRSRMVRLPRQDKGYKK